MKLKLIAAVCGAMLAGSVMAAPEGISIGGNATQNIQADSITNSAGGGNAVQEVGAVTGNVEIGGNLSQKVDVAGEIANDAGGGNAVQRVGVIEGGSKSTNMSISQ